MRSKALLLQESAPFCLNFSTFVPSLSWQMLGLQYKMAQKRRFLTSCEVAHGVGAANPPALHPRKHRSLFEFYLCLSRACLGKRILLCPKVDKKCRFLTWFEALHPAH
jgi:hypothetical protein